MAHRLNTNKQFMIGNAILAFALIIVVVSFVYMSLRMQQEKKNGKQFAEVYQIELRNGFAGDSISMFLNDSLLINQTIVNVPLVLNANRLDKENTLIIVDNLSETMRLFPLAEEGGTYIFEKMGSEIEQVKP